MGKLRRRRAAKAKAPSTSSGSKVAMKQKRKQRSLRGRVSTNTGDGTDTLSSVIQAHWDSKLSLEENYKILGLETDPNRSLNARRVFAEDMDAADEHNVVVGERVIDPGEVGTMKIASKGDSTDSEEEEAPAIAELRASAAIENEEAAQRSRIVAAARKLELKPAERQLMAKLIAKYDNDYRKMARDIKLNPYQRTPKQLERLAIAFAHHQSRL